MMRLTEQDDTDIALDEHGQPVTDADGNIRTVHGIKCWMQDILCEAQTQEGELLHEDEEGRWAYGFGLAEFLNGDAQDLQMELYARIREKLAKREFIDEDSIRITISRDEKEAWNIFVTFREVNSEEEKNIDIRIDRTEVYVR